MLGRPVSGGRSLLQLPIRARRAIIPHTIFQCRSTNSPIPRVLIVSLQRGYASTPGRPRSTVGEPSRTVKRAVKRAARTPGSGDAQTKKVGRPKKATKAKAKAKPKTRKVKELTPEQQARKTARLAQEKVRNLKKIILSPPPDGTHVGAWRVFTKEKMGERMANSTGTDRRVSNHMKAVAQEWRDASAADHEHYNHLAVQQRQAEAAAYKRWVESHTPEQIAEANRARKQLKRLNADKKRQTRYPLIKDERAVKRPVSSYMQFSMNRQNSGDFKNIPIGERARLIGQEWRALNEGEKKKYNDFAAQDQRRYSDEYTHVFGHAPAQNTASAAA